MEKKIERIVLCIKPVKTDLLFQNSNADGEAFSMNPYELKALENLIKLKRNGEERFCLTCICMGDKKAKSILRRALSMGADEGILISDSIFAGSDTVATTYILQKAVEKLGNVKMIVCGVKTIDGETGQVPLGLCERLGFPFLVNGNEILKVKDTSVIYKYRNEKETKIMESKLPAVMKYRDFKMDLPIISLAAIKKGKKKEILLFDSKNMEIDPKRCGIKGSKTKVIEIKNKYNKQEKRKLEGNIQEMVEIIINLLGEGEEKKEGDFG